MEIVKVIEYLSTNTHKFELQSIWITIHLNYITFELQHTLYFM